MDQQIADRIADLEVQISDLEAKIAGRPVRRTTTPSDRPDPRQAKLDALRQQLDTLFAIGEELATLQAQAYDLRQEMNAARRAGDAARATDAQKRLFADQRRIVQLTEQARKMAMDDDDARPSKRRVSRGAKTTRLVAQVLPQMAQAPTAYCHLLDADSHPLVRCNVRNVGSSARRIRVITFIEGYTAQDIKSFELPAGEKLETSHLPTFFPENIDAVRELTRATLNVLVEDLDSTKVEIHTTQPIWLLARNSAPLAVHNPDTNGWTDLSIYFGAFVTPHRQEVEAVLSDVVAEAYSQALSGYQAGVVTPQVEAIYKALQNRDMRYVDSTIDFAPEQGAGTQRVRLPRETLQQNQANCIDGTLLFASLLEAIGINPAIVIVPGHAFVGWSTVKPAGAPGSENQDDDKWDYLETTYLGTDHDFEQARKTGRERAKAAMVQQREADADLSRQGEVWLRRWSLRDLRARHGITPME